MMRLVAWALAAVFSLTAMANLIDPANLPACIVCAALGLGFGVLAVAEGRRP